MTLDYAYQRIQEGLIKDNYATTTLVNNTTATRSLAVPTNRRWWLYGGVIYNADNVARQCSVVLTNSTPSVLFDLASVSLATLDRTSYPEGRNSGTTNIKIGKPTLFPLKAGDIILFTWTAGGASAGGTAFSTAIVQEAMV